MCKIIEERAKWGKSACLAIYSNTNNIADRHLVRLIKEISMFQLDNEGWEDERIIVELLNGDKFVIRELSQIQPPYNSDYTMNVVTIIGHSTLTDCVGNEEAFNKYYKKLKAKQKRLNIEEVYVHEKRRLKHMGEKIC